MLPTCVERSVTPCERMRSAKIIDDRVVTAGDEEGVLCLLPPATISRASTVSPVLKPLRFPGGLSDKHSPATALIWTPGTLGLGGDRPAFPDLPERCRERTRPSRSPWGDGGRDARSERPAAPGQKGHSFRRNGRMISRITVRAERG